MFNLLRNLLIMVSVGSLATADVILYPVQDRDVYQGTGMPTGTPESLGVSSSAAFGGGHSQKSLIQFDVRQQTVGMTAAEVGSATLRLYVMRPEVYPRGYDIGGTIWLYFQTTAWMETNLYWASFNAGEQVASLTLVADRDLGDGSGTWVYPISTWVEVDVTGAVKQWLDGTVPNYGLVLAPDEQGSPYLSSVFADSITGFKPQLVIVKKAVELNELKVTHFGFDGTVIELEWDSVAGKTYTVRESVDLENWQPRDTVVAAGASTVSTFTGTAFPEGRAFYQIVENDP